MSDVVIRVENLSKRYVIKHAGARSGDGLRHALQDAASAPFRRLRSKFGSRNAESTDPIRNPQSAIRSSEDFWALKDVSFEVRRGEVLGIIGRNGAGKSTLLKILSRITEPTSGRIGIKGRVASLLEVGTGFHPELTGRENIFLNGAILGMTRAEIRRQFNAIVDFSGVEKFLDTPVKRYSSGMYVRLAFAVAAHLQSEILVVDEVLAVGDAEFQKKCLGKMKDVAAGGRTVLFVSHDIRTIRNLCSRGIYLGEGRVLREGQIEGVVGAYMSMADHADLGLPLEKNGFILQRFDLAQETGHAYTLDGGSAILVTVEFALRSRVSLFRLGIYLKTAFGETITRAFTSDWHPERETLEAGEYQATLEIPGNLLMPGIYRLGLHASRYGIGGFISEADIQREITLLPPARFNTAHPSETIEGMVMLAAGWQIERKGLRASSCATLDSLQSTSQ